MALLLVAGTSVPALWRMYCPEMGKSRMAWVEIESCCHPDATSDRAELRMHCCEYTVAQADLSTLERSAAVRLLLPTFAAVAWAPLLLSPGNSLTNAYGRFHPERPPPLTGTERSALLRVIRV